MATDPLSFLDQSQVDPLSFLDTQPDSLSFLDQPIQQTPTILTPSPQAEPSFLQKTKDYFTSGKLGEALVMQQKSGGYSGAPTLTPEQAAKVGTEVGTIAAVEGAFAPLYGAVVAAKYAPRVLTALTRLTQAGATGAATATTSKLQETGELPSQEELVKNGLTWVAIDAIMQTLHVTAAGGAKAYEFGKAVNDIAKKDNIPRTQVLGKLWDATKNYVRSKFGRSIETPQDITPQDVQILENLSKQAEKEGINVVEKPIVGPKKPIEAIPWEGIDKLPEIQRQMYQEQLDRIERWKEGHTTDVNGWEMPSLGGIYLDLADAHYLPPKIQDRYEKLARDETFEVENKKAVKAMNEAEREEEKPKYKEIDELIKNIHHSENSNKELREWSDKLIPDIKQLGIANNAIGVLEEFKIKSWMDRDLQKKIIRARQLLEDDLKFLIDNSSESSRNTFAPIVAKRAATLRRLLEKRPVKKEIPKQESPLGFPKGERPEPKKIRPEGLPETFVFKRPILGKVQAKKRSDILKNLRKTFNDPIRLGKISQRGVAGIHKFWSRVTRMIKDNDIETAAHEIGHNLHTLLYRGDAKNPSQERLNIGKALKPYLDELKPMALYEPWGMEGFAEFTRLYVTNPDLAQKAAPKFYQKFEADLEAQFPELKNALLEAREYYDTYLQGTPESRIDAQTDFAEDSSKLENLMDWVKDAFNLDNLKTQFLDDVFPAKRLVAEAFGIPLSEVENLKDPRNLYRSLRVLKGAIGKADVFTMFETFNAATLEKTGKGLRQILQQLPDAQSYREFNRYLIARRSLEKTGQNIETGINFGDAVVVHKELGPKYDNLANQLDHYNDQLLQYARDAGLLSMSQYSAIKKNNMMYVPFQRVMEPEKGGGAATAGSVQAGKPIKRMKGSTRDIIAPIESVLKNTYSIIVNAEKNLSGQVLAKLADMKGVGSYVERVPTPIKLQAKIQGEEVEKKIAQNLLKMGITDLLEVKEIGGKAEIALREDLAAAIPDVFKKFGTTSYPAGENIVTVYHEGKPIYYEVSPEIFEMWNKGIAPYTSNILTKILRVPARTLRAGAILNPKFIQKNFIRDTWGGFLFTKYGKSIKDPMGFFIDTIYAPLAMLATATKQGPLYVDWLKAGGGMSTMQSLDRQGVMKKLEEVRKGYNPLQVVKWLRKVAEISEESNRLAEYGRALKVEGETRLGKEIAAFASRDLSIDFAKMGLQTKALNQIIPFFNATIQGTDKFFRTAFSKEDQAEFLARVVGFVVIPALMIAWLNQDDENVQEFQEQEKDFNFIVRVGGTYLKIPVPFETGVIANGLTQRMYNYFIKHDPEAFEGFMGSIKSAMMPNFIPSFANPVIEVQANKNFFTGGRLIPPDKERLISKYQYRNYTSLTARLLGRAISYMLGPDTRSKAASPIVIDHFINSWAAGLGRLIVSISDSALEIAGLGDKISKPSQAITEQYGLDAFSARFPRANTKSIEKFYDNYQDATARRKSADYAKKMQLETKEGVEEAYNRIEKIYDYPTLQRAYKAMQSSQKAINNIFNDPDLDSDLKRQMIDDLYLQQIQFARAANEDIKKYRLAQSKS